MTAYWDDRQREVTAAFERAKSLYDPNVEGSWETREKAVIETVISIEGRAARAVTAVAMLVEFPPDLGLKIAAVIDRATTIDSLRYRLTTASSEMIGDLHSIFHEVASRKIQTPFGVLSDDPQSTLKRLDANGKDAFEEHIDTCPDCDMHRTLGNNRFCDAGNALEKQWGVVHTLMTEGVPVEEWPK